MEAENQYNVIPGDDNYAEVDYPAPPDTEFPAPPLCDDEEEFPITPTQTAPKEVSILGQLDQEEQRPKTTIKNAVEQVLMHNS